MEQTDISIKDIDKSILEDIDKIQLSGRAAQLRDLLLTCKPRVAGERVPLTIQAWQESEGDPLDLRWAKLAKKVLEGVPVPIFQGQKIVGNITKYFRGVYPHSELDGAYLPPLLAEEEGKSTLGGMVEKAIISKEDLELMSEGVKFFQGKTHSELATKTIKELMGDWYENLQKNGNSKIESEGWWAEIILWDRLIYGGLRSFIEEIKERMNRFADNGDNDLNKYYFWKAALMSLEAVITFARRYAGQARDLAVKESDPAWRKELEEIARICEWVPENPARTFREAIQSVALLYVAIAQVNMAYGPTTWGRPDKYLYPFFKKDLSEGRLTLEDAVDLVSDLFLLAARVEVHAVVNNREFNQRSALPTSLGLAGTDEEGHDICNELTYLILHTLGLTGYEGAHVAVGWHKDIAPWLMEKAVWAAWKTVGGMPQFHNIDHCVNLMQKRGVELKHARNWTSNGCSDIGPGDAPISLYSNILYNIALCVDLALHNGTAHKTGTRLGPETGDPRTFKTFEEFYQAFQKQTEHMIRKQTFLNNIWDSTRCLNFRQPLVSAFMPGCIENGKDHQAGGCYHYKINNAKDRGIIPAAESLSAIKELVYDDKKISMDELLDALDNNFNSGNKRREEIRRMCLAVPKYGNDFVEPDEMVRKVGKFTASLIESEKNIFGEPFMVVRSGQGWHWQVGMCMAALPYGRKAGKPLSDGSLAPVQGMDKYGPTALLNSVLKADFSDSMASVLTPTISASLLKTKELRNKLTHFTDSFLRQGGTYIQYNIVDVEVLKEAKRNPEKFRNLVVRVGGFSAYFVNLSPEIQDEIIARTEHIL